MRAGTGTSHDVDNMVGRPKVIARSLAKKVSFSTGNAFVRDGIGDFDVLEPQHASGSAVS